MPVPLVFKNIYWSLILYIVGLRVDVNRKTFSLFEVEEVFFS